ncbi:MAG: aldehyde ferredoxin oxidoreductase N-terminal domain-containing protein [Spirochaetota bacterium]|nr:aldehyde ferredoxin oxidoreductase N-terminal domain-containing protein [Spirochaetota bacterium]
MTYLKGYAGSILKVNLSTGLNERVPTEDYADLYLGGRGIAVKIYWDESPPHVEAFDPESRLIFATGPVTAVTGFAGSRWQVCGKSPIHNQFSFCNLGGAWGAQLKHAGFDALVLHGRADKPVYLWINGDDIELRDATHLMGKGAITCREELKEKHGSSVRVVAIGPAGENGVTFSTFLADSDSSGSSGLASVMGSKNLKAIAVRGENKIHVANRQKIRDIKEKILVMIGGPVKEVLPLSPMIPIDRLKKNICYGCMGACIRATFPGEDGKRGKFMCQSSIFYEIRAFRYYGEYNEVPYLANKLCDDYGLDTHGVETMIMWLSRCYKSGLLTDEQTGIPISKIGSREFIETLIRKISHREDFGDVLAQGTHKAASTLGEEGEKLITDYITKTGYNPVYGARMYLTTGIFYATEPRLPIQLLHEVSTLAVRWAIQAQASTSQSPLGEFSMLDSLRNIGISSDAIRGIGKRFWGSEVAADFSTYEGKAMAGVRIQDRQYAKESLILCDFTWPILYSAVSDDHVGDPTLESQLYTAVTGQEIDENGLYKIGERIYNLQRAVHNREGRKGREYDTLEEFNFIDPLKGDFGNPECLVPGKDGEPFSRRGMVVDREAFKKMMDEYYDIRGWDVSTGLQTKAKLNELNMKDVAQTLESEGLLA